MLYVFLLIRFLQQKKAMEILNLFFTHKNALIFSKVGVICSFYGKQLKNGDVYIKGAFRQPKTLVGICGNFQ